MSECVFCRDPLGWVEFEQLLEQINSERVSRRVQLLERHLWHPRKGADLDLGRVVHQAPDSVLVRCPQDPQDLIELIIVVATTEERYSTDHFCHDTSRRPDVDAGRVGSAT